MCTPWSLLAVLAALLLVVPVAAAQQETATMTGEVTDASGAVVPGATVTVTNVATGISVKTEANDDGVYTVPSLRPGDVRGRGRERRVSTRTVRSGVTLQVAQVARHRRHAAGRRR